MTKTQYMVRSLVMGVLGGLALLSIAYAQQDSTLAAFDSTRNYILRDIAVQGARRTKVFAILRELNVRAGDTLSGQAYAGLRRRNQELVYNTYLFNKVELRDSIVGQDVYWHLQVRERWYIWPELTFNLEDRTIQDWLRNPDFRRVSYGVGVNWFNMTGRNDKLYVSTSWGFTRRVTVQYDRPFIIPKHMIGGGIEADYASNEEVIYGSVNGSIRRFRWLDEQTLRSVSGRLYLSKRFTQNHGVVASMGMRRLAVLDTVYTYNPDYLTQPGGQEYFSWNQLHYWYDSRDVRAFPLSGTRAQVTLSGWGLVGPATTRYGRLTINLAHYWRFGRSRWYGVLGAHSQNVFGGRIPYPDKVFTRQLVRGFDSYIIDGSWLVVGRSELKWALVHRKIRTWRWLPDKFEDFPFGIYPFAFADAGYMRDDTATNRDPFFKNRLLLGYGVGIDVPYFYDQLFRVSVAFNNFKVQTLLLNLTVAIR